MLLPPRVLLLEVAAVATRGISKVAPCQTTLVVSPIYQMPTATQRLLPQQQPQTDANTQKAGFEVSLFPWMPLSADKKIPVTADWLITMVEPTAKLKEMYIEDVVNGSNSKDNSLNNKSDSDK